MGYALGIDVGTTFSAAAIWRDDRVEVVAFEPNRLTVPTVMFSADGHVLFGTSAVTRGRSQSAGVAREFKRRLGDPVPVLLSGAPYAADNLVAMFAKWIVDAVAEQLGGRPDALVMTHPANWTRFQLNLLAQALDEVGLGDTVLYSEPEAAAYDYASTADLPIGDLVLVYDLGGGTFDVACLRRGRDGLEYVGEAAGVERLGGIDVDEAVFEHVQQQLPAEAIDQARSTGPGRAALAQLRQACVDAKEGLSGDVAIDIPVVLPDHTATVRLTRPELEQMIRPMLGRTLDCVRQVMARADLAADDLSAVLLIGGASRTPLVAELVGATLGVAVRIDTHPKLVVARGAARRAAATRPVPVRAGGRRRRRWRRVRTVLLLGLVGVLAIVVAAVARTLSGPDDAASSGSDGLTNVRAATLIGQDVLAPDAVVDGSPVGGLSGLAFDATRDRYVAVTDDVETPRWFDLSIDIADGRLESGEVRPVSVTLLHDTDGGPLGANALKAEAIALDDDGTALVGDEGSVDPPRPPSIMTFDAGGTLVSDVLAPTWYHPAADASAGIATNGGLRALAAEAAPGRRFVVGQGQPLAQDVVGTADEPPVARILVYDRTTGAPVAEYGYPLERPAEPAAGTSTANALPASSELQELVALDLDGTLLALEHVTEGAVSTARLYEVTLPATAANAPPAPGRPPRLTKRLVMDLAASGVPFANDQGMALGPDLADGRRTLIIVSDDNFGADGGTTRFVALALDLTSS